MKFWLAISLNIAALGLVFMFISYPYLAAFIGASLLFWFFYYLWQRQNVVKERVEEKTQGQDIILPTERIRFRALESSGYSQSDGMGYIALTTDFLYFELVLLDLVITVPAAMIKGAEFVGRLNGVSPAREMLRIIFINEHGENDSIAINGRDMEAWKKSLLEIAEEHA